MIVRYAFRNIMRARLRSLITLVSLSLIILLYTILSSIGNSLTGQITRALDAQETDVVIQAKYAVTPLESNISADIVNTISAYPEVERTEALLVSRKRMNGNVIVYVFGMSDYHAFADRLGIQLLEGGHIDKQSAQLLVGDKTARLLSLNVGEKVELSNQDSYQVVGIYSSWLGILNNGVVLDLAHAQSISGKTDQASVLLLKLGLAGDIDHVVDKINTSIPQMRAMKSAQMPNFLGSIKGLVFFSKIISMVTLLVGIAILINTFVMMINERTKEIAILSAIGWPNRLVIAVLQIEAILLAMVGGLLGYIMSYPVMALIKRQYTTMSVYLPDGPSFHTFLVVMIMCLAVGLVSAIFPLVYGTKIRVSQALHHE